jgi:hypothetical protein
MPLIELSQFKFITTQQNSTYYVGAVVDSPTGSAEVKLIRSESELDNYFPDLLYRTGYLSLLNAGANLVLKNINSANDRSSTLRINKTKYLRYVYPKVYDSIDYTPRDPNEANYGLTIDPLSSYGDELDPESLYQGSVIEITGIAYGNYNISRSADSGITNDSVGIRVNDQYYSGSIDKDGVYKVLVPGDSLLNDPYSRLVATLYINDPLHTTRISLPLEYTLKGRRNINVIINEIGTLVPRVLLDTTKEYRISGYVKGNISTGDTVTIHLPATREDFIYTYDFSPLPPGSTPRVEDSFDRGYFYMDIPIKSLQMNSKVEVVATVTDAEGYRYQAYSEQDYIKDYIQLDIDDKNNVEAHIDIQSNGTKTLVYDINFGTSEMLPQDYLIIPQVNLTESTAFGNKLIYFMSEDSPEEPTPSGFRKPVIIESISYPPFKLIIPKDPDKKELMRKGRAKYIYDLFLGNVGEGLPNTPLETGVIHDLCVLDEYSNSVRLVFSAPVDDISYYDSLSSNPFRVTTNQEYSEELLTTYSRENAIISFSSVIEGPIDIRVKLTHVSGMKFYLEETLNDVSNEYFISLDRDEKDANGESMYAETILEDNSTWLKCIVHANNIYQGQDFTPEESREWEVILKGMEGSYIVTKGIKVMSDLERVQAYEDAVAQLFSSDLYVNSMMCDVFSDLNYLPILAPYLAENNVMAFCNIPDSLLLPDLGTKLTKGYEDLKRDDYKLYLKTRTTLEAIDYADFRSDSYEDLLKKRLSSVLLPDKLREYILYSFGEADLGGQEYLPISFIMAREVMSGRFVARIGANILASDLRLEEKAVFTSSYVNYLEESENGYIIPYINNLPRYLEPIYLLISTFIKQNLTRYLRNKIGEYNTKIYRDLKVEMARLTEYTPLITSLRLASFVPTDNKLEVKFHLELDGLINRILSLNINLNIN